MQLRTAYASSYALLAYFLADLGGQPTWYSGVPTGPQDVGHEVAIWHPEWAPPPPVKEEEEQEQNLEISAVRVELSASAAAGIDVGGRETSGVDANDDLWGDLLWLFAELLMTAAPALRLWRGAARSRSALPFEAESEAAPMACQPSEQRARDGGCQTEQTQEDLVSEEHRVALDEKLREREALQDCLVEANVERERLRANWGSVSSELCSDREHTAELGRKARELALEDKTQEKRLATATENLRLADEHFRDSSAQVQQLRTDARSMRDCREELQAINATLDEQCERSLDLQSVREDVMTRGAELEARSVLASQLQRRLVALRRRSRSGGVGLPAAAGAAPCDSATALSPMSARRRRSAGQHLSPSVPLASSVVRALWRAREAVNSPASAFGFNPGHLRESSPALPQKDCHQDSQALDVCTHAASLSHSDSSDTLATTDISDSTLGPDAVREWCRKQITQVYKLHNPGKEACSVHLLMAKNRYKGNELELYCKICRRYGVQPERYSDRAADSDLAETVSSKPASPTGSIFGSRNGKGRAEAATEWSDDADERGWDAGD
mmetsp:Transcript_165417/g.530778  ORF Transcript_165417/g.530778 Transcript_165417/m.530778 type:complete len:559 (-) Transcript_165417:402-2078(-)